MTRLANTTTLIAVITTLILVLGCGDGTTTLPSTSSLAGMSIDQSPDKPMTTITISVSTSMWLSLTVRDPEGGLVRVLHNGQIQAGSHFFVWNAADDHGETVASGPYWALMTGGDNTAVRAMMLVK